MSLAQLITIKPFNQLLALSLASACLFLATGCSHYMTLRPVEAVPPQQTAQFLPPNSRVFVDDIVKMHISRNRIGKKRNSGGDYLADIKTKSDIPAWAKKQWYFFLKRHECIPVDSYHNADYFVDCTINKLWVEKTWEFTWNDDFAGHTTLEVKIIDQQSGNTVYDERVRGHYIFERPYEENDEIKDEQMYNRCLSASFQKALESIVIQ